MNAERVAGSIVAGLGAVMIVLALDMSAPRELLMVVGVALVVAGR